MTEAATLGATVQLPSPHITTQLNLRLHRPLSACNRWAAEVTSHIMVGRTPSGSHSQRQSNAGHAFTCLPGAMDAGAAVGGIRISREAGTTVRTASYLPDVTAVFCRFLSSRKVLSLFSIRPQRSLCALH